jgi:HSP20 family protein
MALLRWERNDDVFGDLRKMQREMDRLMASVTRGTLGPGLSWAGDVYPPINVISKDDRYLVECELPGYARDDIDLSISGTTLTLKGELKQRDEKGASYHRQERRTGSFSRALQLPERVDPEKTAATFTNGILTVEIPKAPEVRPRQISVKAS